MAIPESFPNVDGPIPGHGVLARGGRFDLEGLPAGRYVATVQFQDEETRARVHGMAELELAASETAEITIPVVVRR